MSSVFIEEGRWGEASGMSRSSTQEKIHRPLRVDHCSALDNKQIAGRFGLGLGFTFVLLADSLQQLGSIHFCPLKSG